MPDERSCFNCDRHGDSTRCTIAQSTIQITRNCLDELSRLYGTALSEPELAKDLKDYLSFHMTKFKIAAAQVAAMSCGCYLEKGAGDNVIPFPAFPKFLKK